MREKNLHVHVLCIHYMITYVIHMYVVEYDTTVYVHVHIHIVCVHVLEGRNPLSSFHYVLCPWMCITHKLYMYNGMYMYSFFILNVHVHIHVWSLCTMYICACICRRKVAHAISYTEILWRLPDWLTSRHVPMCAAGLRYGYWDPSGVRVGHPRLKQGDCLYLHMAG